MTGPEPAGASTPDSVAAAFDDLAESVDRALRNAGKLLDGEYSATEATADLSWYSAMTLGWVRELVGCWAQVASALLPDAPGTKQFPVTNPTITVDIDVAFLQPLTLQAQTFRAIGWGTAFQLDPKDVTFTKSVLQPGETSFEITVSTASLPGHACKRTLVFEGSVVDALTGSAVSDTIRFVRPADPHN